VPDIPANPPETAPDPARNLWFKPQTRTLKSARRTLSRVIREWSAGTVSTEDARAMVWFMSNLLAYFKESAQVELSDRLAAVEKRLKIMEAPKNAKSKDFPASK